MAVKSRPIRYRPRGIRPRRHVRRQCTHFGVRGCRAGRAHQDPRGRSLMAILENSGALSRAAKDLFARWNDVKSVWSDAQSQEFEKNFLFPMEEDVRSALNAI